MQTRPPAASARSADAESRALQELKHEGFITMATGIAHDLNNYLAAIQGNNNVVQRIATLDNRTRECGQRIDAACDLALSLASQLALYSGRVESNPERVDLPALIDAVRTAAAPLLAKGLALDVEVPQADVTLFADPTQVQTLLLNLIANAAESMVDRHGLIHVFIRPGKLEPKDNEHAFFPLDASTPCTEIAVRDGGLGIAPKIRERIFDPFFSTKIRGRGMGLPEVLGIVRLHNGNILVKSQLNAGTTVRVLFPVV